MSDDARSQPSQGAAPAASGHDVLLRLRRRQALRRGLALIAVAVAVLVAALVAARIVGPAPVPETDLAQPPAGLPPDPLGALAPEPRARLLAPALDRSATFKRTYGGHPKDLCAAIDRLGVPMSDWKPDPFVAGFWYCASDLVRIGREAPDGRRSTLFVNLRGPAEEALTSVRLKLSGDNPASAEAARAALLRVLDAIGRRYGWPWPDDLEQAVRAGQAIDLNSFGLRMRVLPEDPELTSDAAGLPRLNVILNFPGVDLVAPAELFAPFSWEEERHPRRARPQGGGRLVPRADDPSVPGAE
ncbi:DUF6030 family protein [Stappia sp.]|uniref:DUF6030 family protein n=1 Tax=Stappia sp. TaxID=1870903 RepID=UPI0032D94CF7